MISGAAYVVKALQEEQVDILIQLSWGSNHRYHG